MENKYIKSLIGVTLLDSVISIIFMLGVIQILIISNTEINNPLLTILSVIAILTNAFYVRFILGASGIYAFLFHTPEWLINLFS